MLFCARCSARSASRPIANLNRGGPGGEAAVPDSGALPSAASDAAYRAFVSRVRSRRIALSYIVEVSYESASAETAARVANAIASSYLSRRIADALVLVRNGGAYTQARRATLEAQAAALEAALRQGEVPEGDIIDADVRVLGPAPVPSAPAGPKAMPLFIAVLAFALLTGLLAILAAPRRRPARADGWSPAGQRAAPAFPGQER